MSQYLIYIQVKPFLRQWLVHHYGEPVVFPPQSAENATIRRFLAKRPKSMVTEDAGGNMLAVCVPDSKQKPAVTYNHLGQYAKDALIECIEDTFKLQMWKDLNDLHSCGCSILKGVQAWCENNGISVDYDRTILMRYQRLRRVYLENDIDLRNKTRNIDNSI